MRRRGLSSLSDQHDKEVNTVRRMRRWRAPPPEGSIGAAIVKRLAPVSTCETYMSCMPRLASATPTHGDSTPGSVHLYEMVARRGSSRSMRIWETPGSDASTMVACGPTSYGLGWERWCLTKMTTRTGHCIRCMPRDCKILSMSSKLSRESKFVRPPFHSKLNVARSTY